MAVGDEPVKEIVLITTETGTLRIISPTESVKDRLAAFYFWKDLQSLDQAVLVSMHRPIDIKEVKRWSLKQREEEKFNIFLDKITLTNIKKSPSI